MSSMSKTASRSPLKSPMRMSQALSGSNRSTNGGVEPSPDVRQRILDTASTLFYERGVRAVGVDLVVQEAAVAKTSLYRYFPTKDDLIVAFLEREDIDFWAQWDSIAEQHADDAMGELSAYMRWIGERLARSNYRGCPQINVAAEFAEQSHPARQVSQRHMREMRSRLLAIAQRMGASQPDQLAAQLCVLMNGAFVSSSLLLPEETSQVLLGALKALLVSFQATHPVDSVHTAVAMSRSPTVRATAF